MEARLKSRPAYSLLLLLAFGLLSIDARALCTYTYNPLTGCVPCRDWSQSYIKDFNTGNCSPCAGFCRAFLVEGDGAEKTSKSRVEYFPDSTASDRQLIVEADQLKAIAIRNPWAASVLITLQQNSDVVNLGSGTSFLTTVPTEEAIISLMAGDASLVQSMPTPAGVLARVSHRLERGPGEVARLFLSSYTVDAEDRMMFKVYPDIVLEMHEAGANKGTSSLQHTTLMTRAWMAVE